MTSDGCLDAGYRMDNLTVGVACMGAIPGEIERNLDKIEVLASDASENGADIVCFPEFSVTGYALDRPDLICSREDSGRITDRLCRISADLGLVVLAGFIEYSGGSRPHIAQIITGPEGVIGCHRKTHLGPTERNFYEEGQEISPFTHGDLCFGVELCYEAHFPEISTALALKGADILFIPHASPRGSPEEKLNSWKRHLPARAFDNGLFVVACNQVGKTPKGLHFPGVAMVFGPDGCLLDWYAGDEEKVMIVELKGEDLETVREHRMRYFLPERREELYGP